MFFCLPLWGFCSVWAVAFVLVVVVGVCVLAVCDFCPPCGVRFLPLIVVLFFRALGFLRALGCFSSPWWLWLVLPRFLAVFLFPFDCCGWHLSFVAKLGESSIYTIALKFLDRLAHSA